MHVDDPNGFVSAASKEAVKHGHNPTAKPRKPAMRLVSAFSFKAKKDAHVDMAAAGSVLDQSMPKPRGRGLLRFSSKPALIREITGRSRSTRERAAREKEGESSCSVM